jgi:hypothetical protein
LSFAATLLLIIFALLPLQLSLQPQSLFQKRLLVPSSSETVFFS